MRPESYRDQNPLRRCETCKHCYLIEYKDDHLCFHGDVHTAVPSTCRDEWVDVILNDQSVGLLDGDEYDAVWGGRAVECDSVCDEWEGII